MTLWRVEIRFNETSKHATDKSDMFVKTCS